MFSLESRKKKSCLSFVAPACTQPSFLASSGNSNNLSLQHLFHNCPWSQQVICFFLNPCMAVSSKSKSFFFFSVTQTIRLALWLDPLDLQLVNALSFPSQEERSRRIRRSCGRSPIKSLLLALMGIKSYSNSPGVCAQERRLREGKVIATAEQKKKKKKTYPDPCSSRADLAWPISSKRLRGFYCRGSNLDLSPPAVSASAVVGGLSSDTETEREKEGGKEGGRRGAAPAPAASSACRCCSVGLRLRGATDGGSRSEVERRHQAATRNR